MAEENFTGVGKKPDLLTERTTRALYGDWYPMVAQSLQCNPDVVRSDQFSACERQNCGSSENFRLKTNTLAAKTLHTIDKFVDREVSVTCAFLAMRVSGQDEVVHAADPTDRVPKAHGNAGAEDGHQDARLCTTMDVALA